MSAGSKFTRGLAIDVETSGLSFGDDPSDGYQILSIGLIVFNVKDYLPIEKLYLEIKWNGEDKWDDYAEKIHKLSKDYLEKNGVDEEEAVADIMEFILRHFSPDKAITLLGHNVATFDKPFFRKLLRKFGFEVKFSHRALDSFPLGFVSVGAFDSDELFTSLGFPARKAHNAMEDIELTLKTYRILNKIMREAIG